MLLRGVLGSIWTCMDVYEGCMDVFEGCMDVFEGCKDVCEGCGVLEKIG